MVKGSEGVVEHPCARCGTFAALRSNGFRAWCEPCWRTVPQVLDAVTPRIGPLTRVLFRLLRDYGLLGVGLALLGVVPLAIATWMDRAGYTATLVWGSVINTAIEAVLLSVVIERTLVVHPGWKVPLSRAARRYFPLWLGNVLTGLTLMLATLALCLPAFPATTLLMVVVPLVLVEGVAPHRAFVQSMRRVWPHFWSVLPVCAVLFTLSFMPSLFDGALEGIRAAKPGLVSEARLPMLRVASVVAAALFNVPSMLFQMVVWSATRPVTVPE